MSNPTRFKKVLSLFLTLTIPLLYLSNLFSIWKFRETASFPLIFIVLGVVLASISVLLWGTSFWQLRSVFQVLPTANKRIKTGIYRWLKHPMYTGIFLTFLGLGLAFQSRQGLAFTFFFVLPLLIVRALLEEKKLTDE